MCYKDEELAVLRGQRIEGIICECGETTAKLKVGLEEVHRCPDCGKVYRNFNGSWMSDKEAIEYCMVKLDTIEQFYLDKNIKKVKQLADKVDWDRKVLAEDIKRHRETEKKAVKDEILYGMFLAGNDTITFKNKEEFKVWLISQLHKTLSD